MKNVRRVVEDILIFSKDYDEDIKLVLIVFTVNCQIGRLHYHCNWILTRLRAVEICRPWKQEENESPVSQLCKSFHQDHPERATPGKHALTAKDYQSVIDRFAYGTCLYPKQHWTTHYRHLVLSFLSNINPKYTQKCAKISEKRSFEMLGILHKCMHSEMERLI
ncbi:hypothetical protein T10_11087 [Trichinella papuae]|uniref:Uncharacterized protein n=1 Tax=Trichinella papuae TaxID=268474 RepID=A0A0V1MWU4_9BILA|nr:hypothetical protein T10_11087 [Trichinella papuae]